MNAAYTRRRFFSLLGGAALTARPRPVRAVSSRANDALSVGVIGMGRQGRLLATLMPRHGMRLSAICDSRSDRLNDARNTWPRSSTTAEYRRVLDRGEIDAVIIAAPDPWHGRMTLDAVSAGKHVYVETPICRTPYEAGRMILAARDRRCVVQTGHAHRSDPDGLRVRRAIQTGAIGRVDWVAMGPPRDETRVGGCEAVDAVRWIMSEPTCRAVVANGDAEGGVWWRARERFHAVFDYGTFTAVFDAAPHDAAARGRIIFHGTDGVLAYSGCADGLARQRQAARATAAHLMNWLDCIRTGAGPNASLGSAGATLRDLLWVQRAYRTGARVSA